MCNIFVPVQEKIKLHQLKMLNLQMELKSSHFIPYSNILSNHVFQNHKKPHYFFMVAIFFLIIFPDFLGQVFDSPSIFGIANWHNSHAIRRNWTIIRYFVSPRGQMMFSVYHLNIIFVKTEEAQKQLSVSWSLGWNMGK